LVRGESIPASNNLVRKKNKGIWGGKLCRLFVNGTKLQRGAKKKGGCHFYQPNLVGGKEGRDGRGS